MIKVGVTGGIGSGKSIICQVFAALQVPVYYADKEARNLTENDPAIKEDLIALFGNHIYGTKELNRFLLAEYIFNDRKRLAQVNQIIHPRVAAHFMDWCNMHKDRPYIIQESAILFESKAYLSFDKVITVTAPENLRIQRVVLRKNMTVEKIHSIMHNQISDSERIKRSQYTIVNDDIQLVIPQVLVLHKTFTGILS